MSTELIAILGVGVTMIGIGTTVVGVILNGQRSQRADIKDLRKEMQEQGVRLEKKMQEQGVRLEKKIQEQGVRLEKKMQEQEIRLEKKIQEQGNGIEKKIQEQGKEIEGVKLEIAALKATVDTYFRIRVDPPQQAAVAEPPEDY